MLPKIQAIHHLAKATIAKPVVDKVSKATTPTKRDVTRNLGIVSSAFIRKDWEEEKHPRAGAGSANGGQFTSQGGGGSAPAAAAEAPKDGSSPAAAKPEAGTKSSEQSPATSAPAATATQPVGRVTTDGKPLATTGSGTKDDPIVTNDVLAAAKAIQEDKYVKLTDVKQVSVLLDKLKEFTDECKARGIKAGNLDLCKVMVPGTSLFCAESAGVPRVKMPQLKGIPTAGTKADALPKDKNGEVDLSKQFIEHLHAAGIGITDEVERADYLKATQNELNGGKVSGMMAAIESGKNTAIRDEPIFVSRNGSYILDGHHRWAAVVGASFRPGLKEPLTMKVRRVDMEIIDLLRAANRFASSWGIPQADVSKAVSKGCSAYGCAIIDSEINVIAKFVSQNE